MAFDRQALVDKITKGGQIPAFTFVPASAGFKPPKGLGYNIEEAKKLLAEAGYPGGKGFPTFQILYNTSSGHQRIAAFIQEEWKRNLGINVTLINQEWSTYLDTRSQTHNFDIARAGWIGDYLDPSTFSDMWVIGGTQNDGLYNSKEYTDLIFKARTAGRNHPHEDPHGRGRHPDHEGSCDHSDLLLYHAKHDRHVQVGRLVQQPAERPPLEVHLQEVRMTKDTSRIVRIGL